jgi:putative component of membrane protein insertase Oxa1/YidC/SpoIIIJ protein YidD
MLARFPVTTGGQPVAAGTSGDHAGAARDFSSQALAELTEGDRLALGFDQSPRHVSDDDLTIRPVSILTSAWWVRAAVALYRRSPMHERRHRNGCTCQFIPTCSEYLERAVEKYGLLRGLAMAVDRIDRCRPGQSGPYVDYP